MPSDEIVYTTSTKVSCDGGKGALGHPLVYLDMTGKQELLCPYCSKRFVLQKQSVAEAHD